MTPNKTGEIDIAQLMHDTLHRKCITYRHHGQNGELRKPMRHRFEVKGGRSSIEAFADNLSMRNPLFERLCKP